VTRGFLGETLHLRPSLAAAYFPGGRDFFMTGGQHEMDYLVDEGERTGLRALFGIDRSYRERLAKQGETPCF